MPVMGGLRVKTLVIPDFLMTPLDYGGPDAR